MFGKRGNWWLISAGISEEGAGGVGSTGSAAFCGSQPRSGVGIHPESGTCCGGQALTMALR